MAPETLAQLAQEPASHDPAATRLRVHADLLKLAAAAASGSALLRDGLRTIAAAFSSPFATLYLRRGSDVIEEECHAGPTDPAFWRGLVHEYLTEALATAAPRARLLNARGAELKVALLAAPVYDSGDGKPGALALVARVGDEDLRGRLLLLENLAALLSHLAMTHAAGSAAPRAADPRAAAGAIARVATVQSPQELAFSISNGLRAKLGCEQVAFGTVRRGRVSILSISGLDHVKPQSPGVVRLHAAMEECLDHRGPIVCQREDALTDAGVSSGHRLHQAWHEASGGAAVASLPLCRGDESVAVLALRQRPNERFTAEQLAQVRQTVEPLAAALEVLARARRGLVRHAVESACDLGAWMLRPGAWGRKGLLAGSLIGVLWLAFGTLPYHVSARAVVAPEEVRHIAMPFPAMLAASHALAGDDVRAGQVLCELNTQDLALQRTELSAQLAAIELERQRASAQNAPAEARLAAANERLTRERLALVERRIEQCTVRAPFDGTLVAGDLRKRVGENLPLGEPLFEIVPTGRWRVDVEAPDACGADLRATVTGRFAAAARPEAQQTIELLRVRPRAELRNGQSVYVAEARVADPAAWIKLGMEGHARLDLGRRPAWWVLTHRLFDYLHLNWWL